MRFAAVNVKMWELLCFKEMPKRISITLPETVNKDLERFAEQQGRSVSNLAAFLLEYAIRLSKESGDYKPED